MYTRRHDLVPVEFGVSDLGESGSIIGVQEVLVVVVLVQESLAGLRRVEEWFFQADPDLFERPVLVPADLDPATDPALDLSLVPTPIDRRPDTGNPESIDLSQVVEDVWLGQLEIASEDGREWVATIRRARPDQPNRNVGEIDW